MPALLVLGPRDECPPLPQRAGRGVVRGHGAVEFGVGGRTGTAQLVHHAAGGLQPVDLRAQRGQRLLPRPVDGRLSLVIGYRGVELGVACPRLGQGGAGLGEPRLRTRELAGRLAAAGRQVAVALLRDAVHQRVVTRGVLSARGGVQGAAQRAHPLGRVHLTQWFVLRDPQSLPQRPVHLAVQQVADVVVGVVTAQRRARGTRELE